MRFYARVIRATVIFICISFATGQVLAQDVEEAGPLEPEVALEQTAAAEEQKNVEEGEPEEDRFFPTEQVSQDLGVSFPVDI
jgi:hypothetical protein